MSTATTLPADASSNGAASGRIDDIECLRAIAVIGVLLHHLQGPLYYWYPDWHPAWLGVLFKHLAYWSGVDLFFAISGFVIARSLLPQLAATAGDAGLQRKTVFAFWIRRAFRLLPSAWLWLALIMLAVLFFNKSGVFGTLHANLWATATGMANVANFRFADSFMRYEYGASFSYWTLSLEEQFYVLLPLAALLLRRHLVWLLALLIVVQFVAMRTPLGMSVRTEALAWISADPNGATLNWRVGLIAILCVTLVWLASYGRGYICASGRLKNVLMWIGSRSYAIYLIHIPAYFFVRECFWRLGMAGNPPPAYSSFIYAATAMLVIFVLAEANYRWVETPLRARGMRLARRILPRNAQADPPKDVPATTPIPL